MGDHRSRRRNSARVSEQLIQSWVAQRGRAPMIVSRASGIHIWDAEGRSYADFASGQISVNVGYGRPEIEDAIRRQLNQVAYVAPVYRTEVEIELAAMVVEVTPPALRHVFFTNSGTEGVETAMKIARATTGRAKIYSAWQSYHGSTLGSSTVSGDPRRLFADPGSSYQPKFLLPNPYRNPFSSHDPETVASAALALLTEQIEFEGPETIAALLIEPMVGTSGLYIPPASFMRGLRTLCERHGILLIFDETMTGWGRTGRWFAADHFGVTPDIMVTAKGITSGYIPFGCVVVTTAIYEQFLDRPFVAGSTTEGHALGCAAGLANIAVYRKEHLVTRSEQMGNRMIDGLQALKRMHPSVGDVRGCGLFACIELTSDAGSRAPLAGYRDARGEVASRLLNALLDRGVSTIAKWDFLFFAPPLVVEEAQIDDALEKLDEALKSIDELVC